jgi:hypothetical protein
MWLNLIISIPCLAYNEQICHFRRAINDEWHAIILLFIIITFSAWFFFIYTILFGTIQFAAATMSDNG